MTSSANSTTASRARSNPRLAAGRHGPRTSRNVYIPGIGKNSWTSIVAPGAMKWGWPFKSSLRAALEMSQSALSRQLAWMAQRGWVDVSAGVGRARRVRMASQGDTRIRQALPRWQRAQDAVVASLGEQPWQRLLGGVRRLATQRQ